MSTAGVVGLAVSGAGLLYFLLWGRSKRRKGVEEADIATDLEFLSNEPESDAFDSLDTFGDNIETIGNCNLVDALKPKIRELAKNDISLPDEPEPAAFGFFDTFGDSIETVGNHNLVAAPKTTVLIDSSAKIRAESFTTRGLFYQIDLVKMECSCPDWSKRRSHYPKDHPKRLCKHLVAQICTRCPDRFPIFMDMIRYQRADGRGVPLDGAIKVLNTDHGPLVLDINPPRTDISWISIFAKGVRYGYSPEIRKWAHRKELPDEYNLQFLCYIHKGEFPEPLSADAITTIRRSRERADIPKHLAGTKGLSGKLVEQGGWIAYGEVEGVTVRGFVTPASYWQKVLVEGKDIPYNVRSGEWEGPESLLHLRSAGMAWLKAEYDACCAEQKERRAQKKVVRKKTDPEELKARARERKRLARQIVTTDEKLLGLELVRKMFHDTDLAYTDVQKYFVIHLEGAQKKWLCRLHLNGKTKKYVEIEAGKKIVIESMESVPQYYAEMKKKLETL